MHLNCLIEFIKSEKGRVLLGFISFDVLQKVEEKLLFDNVAHMTMLVFLSWPQTCTQDTKLWINIGNWIIKPRWGCSEGGIHKFWPQNKADHFAFLEKISEGFKIFVKISQSYHKLQTFYDLLEDMKQNFVCTMIKWLLDPTVCLQESDQNFVKIDKILSCLINICDQNSTI